MVYKPGYTSRVRQAVSGGPAPAGPAPKKGGRRSGAGPPLLDATDLSRRLLVVQAERTRKEKAGHGEPPAAEHVEAGRGPLKEKKGQPQPQPQAPPPSKTTSKKKKDHTLLRKISNESPKSSKEYSRRKSGENEPSVPASQPYIPREAAAQFHRTATPIGMLEGPLAHRLSRQALKASFDQDVKLQQPVPLPSSSGIRRSASQRDASILDRAHARPPRIVEEVEDSTDIAMPSMTARTKPSKGVKDEQKNEAAVTNCGAGRTTGHKKRPSSTGDLAYRLERHELHQQLLNRQSILVTEVENEDTLEKQQEVDEDIINPEFADEHRVDWTQSDETKHESVQEKVGENHSPSAAGGPALGSSKRRKSIFGLRMKFGQHTDNHAPGTVEETLTGDMSAPLSPKSPKARFSSN